MKRLAGPKKPKAPKVEEGASLTVTELFRSCLRDSLAVLGKEGTLETCFPSPELRPEAAEHLGWACYHLECLRALASAQIVNSRTARPAKPPNSPGGLAS